MSGLYPFEGDNVYSLYENISAGALKLPEGLDSLTEHLLESKFDLLASSIGMLENDPKKRCTVEWLVARCVHRTLMSRDSFLVALPG